MTKIKVLKPKYLPTRAPVSLTMATCLLLDRVKAPGWVWGVVGTLLMVLWVAFFASLGREEMVEPKELL